MLHPLHVGGGDDVLVAGGRDDDVRPVERVIEGRDLVAVHGRLQCADRVDLGHDDARALASQRVGAALAYVAVAADHGHLAADQDVGGPVDPVHQRVPAAVLVVELGLGDRVVHVDGGEEQLPVALHLVEPVDAGGGLLGHAFDAVGDRRPAARLLGQAAGERRQDDRVLLGVSRGGVGHGAELLELDASMDVERGIAPVVEDHGGAADAGPAKGLLGAPPVLLQCLALPGEDRHPARLVGRAVRADGDCGSCVVLRREDVAAGPAHLGAERGEGLDKHSGLDGHVQRAGDAGTGQGPVGGELRPHGHEAGHLVLGELDLFAAEGRQVEVGHLEIGAFGSRGHLGSLCSPGGCPALAGTGSTRASPPTRLGQEYGLFPPSGHARADGGPR